MNHKLFSPSHPNAPASELSRIPGSTAAIRAMGKKAPTSKHQAPEKFQTSGIERHAQVWSLVLGASLELGRWSLEFFASWQGTFAHEPTSQSLKLK
jgi:hypothetical protein